MSVEGHLGLWGYSYTSASPSAVGKEEGKKDLLAGIQFCLCGQEFILSVFYPRKKHHLQIRNLNCKAISTRAKVSPKYRSDPSDVSSLTNTPVCLCREETHQAISIATFFTWHLGTFKCFWRHSFHYFFFYKHTQNSLLNAVF